MSETNEQTGGFGVFAQLTRALRRARTVEELYFSIVNETRRLTPYRRAALLRPASDGGKLRVVAASGVPIPDRQTPFIRWLEQMANQSSAESQGKVLYLAAPTQAEQEEFGLGPALWAPLLAQGETSMGGLWLERAQPWRESEALLLGELADAQAHALWSVEGGGKRRGRSRATWMIRASAAALLIAACFFPVRRAALAPVEIVAADSEVVAAPVDGVIRSFYVQPNQAVAAGDVLFMLDDTDRRARLEVAAKALDIARVEHRQASQGALSGRRDAPKLAALEAQIALKEIELENARQQLERTRARAARSGVALLPDTQEYIGRPVATGERVMQVADPALTEARAWLAIHDAMPTPDGAAVRIFLDSDPLNPLDGAVLRVNHEAEDVPGGGFAYRVMIALSPESLARAPRIGARGTARIDGDQAPLFLYLFRRPIAALRQTVGF